MWSTIRFAPDKDIPDLAGKVILVTGGMEKCIGNTGLGKETVQQLVKHNPRNVFLAARTQSKAEDAINTIKEQTPEANITFVQLDLTSLESINRAAEIVLESSDRLDVLLNNAGIMGTPPGLTTDGFEIQLGTNHVGHFQLTQRLLPLLQKTASLPNSDVRIVNVTSLGHWLAPSIGIDFDDITLASSSSRLGPWTRYGQSKLANILFTKELARRYPDIKSLAVHPGVIHTGLYASAEGAIPLMHTALSFASRLVFSTVPEGALNQLWATFSDEAVSGCYYSPVGIRRAGSGSANSDELATKLWSWTKDQVAAKGF
ncbi:MAG: hypothetical protein M1814_003214 [Vezdaea aestivalis]|nr:MAG: hypothetical protein M1814_003214 [Vezdaea aestivalis]